MKNNLILLVLLFPCWAWSQTDIVDSNYYAAYKKINQLKNKYLTSDKNPAYLIKFKGIEIVKSHSKRPYLVDTCSIHGQLEKNGDAFQEVFSIRFREKDYQSKVRFQNDSSFVTAYGDTTLKRYSIDLLSLEFLYDPYNVIDLINRNKKSLHYLPVKKGGIVGFSGINGGQYYCFFHSGTELPYKIKKISYDPILGDIDEEIIYSDYKKISAISFPQSIVHTKGEAIYRRITFDSIEFPDPVNGSSKTGNFNITLDTLDNNLFLVNLNNYNNRVMLLKAGDDMAVFDAPISFDVCSNLIKYIHAAFPKSTIKMCFVSHHHPDHAGGIAAFAKAGAKIITTVGNYQYFESVLNAVHTRSDNEYSIPIKNKATGNYLDSVPISQNRKFSVNNVPVIAWEHGMNTTHTDQYLSFYLPDSKILFVGDLVLFSKEKEIPQGARANAVLKLIDDNHLTVNRITTSWPLKGYKSFGTKEELMRCVAGLNNVK